MKILVGGISTKFASCPSRNSSQMCSYKKGKKKKKSKSKDSGRGRSPTDESFQEISGRGEEKQHRKHVKESGKQKLLQNKALPVFCKSLNELKRLCKVPLIAIKQGGMGW